jgi:ATP-dependent DNA helicase RecQ
MPKKNLNQYLEKYFNFKKFRSGQKEIVEAVLSGKDTVALMPTGGGKSLCYQLPAILSGKTSVIISPLIALMRDQVSALNARGIQAAFINSTLSFREVEEVMQKVKNGEIKILYIAPERLANPRFLETISGLDVSLLAVDEAHCLSQWGHDFRPNYLKIKECVNLFKNRPTIAAFTATATPQVKNDIISQLNLQEPKVFIRGFDRPNLVFLTQSNLKPGQRYPELLRITKSLSGSGIIYALTRKETETIAQYLNENGIETTAYHAGLDGDKREKIQSDFMQDRFRVIVATIAFGMGVDKPDIRFVIHCGMPKNLEGYYQEAGRAGRDGKRAYCVLLHSKKDVSTHKFFIRKDRLDMESQGKDREEMWRILKIKYRTLEEMEAYAIGEECRRMKILRYFKDPAAEKYGENCGGCDICLNWKGKAGGEEYRPARKRGLDSSTVQTTARLYQDGFNVDQIVESRNLKRRTIVDHLARWYQDGGDLKIRDFVSSSEQSLILDAIKKVGTNKLKPIKQTLPETIDYDKIKLVLAQYQQQRSSNNI